MKGSLQLRWKEEESSVMLDCRFEERVALRF